METLIELFDERPLENVLSTQVFAPERTVFICPPEIMRAERERRAVRSYLASKAPGSETVFESADMYDAKDVLRALEAACEKYPSCVLDITGGTDAALFASGVFCARRNVPAFTYSRRSGCFYSINNAPFGEKRECDLRLSVEDCFLMAGGAVKRGRVDNAVLGKYLKFFDPFFGVYMRFRREWTSIVNYMQRVSAPVNGEISLSVRGAYSVKSERGGLIRANEGALEELRRIGFIKNVEIVPGESVSFRFRDTQIRTWLRDIGSVLETYVYKACLDTGAFDDVCTSVVVDWEGDLKQNNVTNELDVMTTKGVMPVFISCKTGELKTEALNELAILRDRFGGRSAKAACVTCTKCQSITRHRASELNITVIDIDDLRKNRLHERLRALAEAEK